jgi:inner membrane protease subunit 2
MNFLHAQQPTLNPDTSGLRQDVVLLDRSPTWSPRQLQRGDVVLFHSPHQPDTLSVKRIVALEGDTIKTLRTYPDATVQVPRGHAWVEGDEPFHSRDSNYYGPVRRSRRP